ncbi:MAG: 16S rRNA (cytosine(967)-C(5))-methyltransferase RsmB [Gemmatimonadaceae bacterium]|nr:16S rRNA (cytosine(967)-C(5))-methyltransferase RsmB [Gemmatimonadaceae bacterium]MCW5825837.1 16S rRNA (cytosine(967)-C(5))-methyltransferase RsmB [Gemmatimonadaceae bacterium]
MPSTLPLVTDARIAAAETLADLRSGFLLDAAFDRRTAALDARDRRWTQELVWGMLRRRGWIDHLLAPRVRGGIARLEADLADLLRLGVYQLLYMGSVPAYAAIAQTVELAKTRHGLGASKLANAVLRRIERERDALDAELPADPVEALAVEHSHPRWLVARWVARWGAEETRALLEANNREAPLIVRPWGVVREQLETMLEESGVGTGDAPLVEDSLLLAPGTVLTALGAFQQGRCFVQDPAATLVTRYAALPPGLQVADLCAAPGGKSVELARHAAHVTAADSNENRIGRVIDTIGRLELENVDAVVADARDGTLGEFDAVLVDAPCTGTGTFRRHPDARWRLRTSDLAVMAAAQRAVLRGAAKCVKPGGLLIYSTCSLEPEENDAQVEAFLADHPGWTLEPPPAGTVPDSVLDAGRLRVLPQRHGSDGSFAARLRRGNA